MGKGRSEKAVSAEVALAVSRLGGRVGRNNVGIARYISDAGKAYTVKYGVFGEGAADWLGWQPVTITPDMVGQTVAVFLAVETKRQRGGTLERKQRNFAAQVAQAGGISVVARSAPDLEEAINTWRPGAPMWEGKHAKTKP